MAKYRYSLGRQTGICPQCGRRSFKFYVDNATGEIVDESCGRCNRENNCRYHSKPNEYVKKAEFINSIRPSCLNGRASDGYDTIEPRYAVQSPSMWRYDALFHYLCAVFGGSVMLEVFALCGVTHAKAMQGSTVFWLKDARGSLRSGKVMKYGLDGHRLKDSRIAAVSWVHALLKLQDFNYRACYFGEHLASRIKNWKIVLVESEKTALVLTAAMLKRKISGYVALATGGCAGLNVDIGMIGSRGYKGNVLVDRDVVVVPDADKVDEWRAKCRTLAGICASVEFVDVTQEPYLLTDSEDIGDYVIRRFTS